jgi:ribosomal protein S18 acetylase RimI-like enzyme
MFLAGTYWVTRDYAARAAKMDWDWLEGPSKAVGDNGNGIGSGVKKSFKGDEPIVIVSRWGEEIIAALVLRVAKRDRKGYVRAWTVDSSHRGKGVGRSLLQEGVRIAWGKGARVMELESRHANSHRVLPQTFNRGFDEQEARAGLLLTDLVAQHKREKSSR